MSEDFFRWPRFLALHGWSKSAVSIGNYIMLQSVFVGKIYRWKLFPRTALSMLQVYHVGVKWRWNGSVLAGAKVNVRPIFGSMPFIGLYITSGLELGTWSHGRSGLPLPKSLRVYSWWRQLDLQNYSSLETACYPKVRAIAVAQLPAISFFCWWQCYIHKDRSIQWRWFFENDAYLHYHHQLRQRHQWGRGQHPISWFDVLHNVSSFRNLQVFWNQ